MRKWIQVVLLLALAIVLVNDVSRVAATHYSVNNIAARAADSAARLATTDDPTIGYAVAQQVLASENATVTGYTQENGRVRVWVDGPIEGSILLAPIVSLWNGGAWTDPVMIRKDQQQAY